jgi:transcriptional regulator with XRE-family HTH domain
MSLVAESAHARALAERIRALRLREGWSQVELARRAGVNPITYALFERTGRIALERLLKVFAVLRRLDEFDRLAVLDDTPASLFDAPSSRPRQRGRTSKRSVRPRP